MEAVFIDSDAQTFNALEAFPGASWIVLAEPVPQGSIHRLRMTEGTVIPPHVHPADEYVYVLKGTIETGGRECLAGTFWKTPAGTRQGPHIAITDVELMTVRLGAMGEFKE